MKSSSSASISINHNRRKCKCGQCAVVCTALKQPNAGKRFLRCPFYDKQAGITGCGYFKWYKDEDEEEEQSMDVRDLAYELELVKNSNVELSDYIDNIKGDNTELLEMVEKVNEENKQLKKKVANLSAKNKILKNVPVHRGNRLEVKVNWKIAIMFLLIVVVCYKLF